MKRISKYQKHIQSNLIVQFFKFITISLRVMFVVAGGHGGTRAPASK
jgi:hypothetical protein